MHMFFRPCILFVPSTRVFNMTAVSHSDIDATGPCLLTTLPLRDQWLYDTFFMDRMNETEDESFQWDNIQN